MEDDDQQSNAFSRRCGCQSQEYEDVVEVSDSTAEVGCSAVTDGEGARTAGDVCKGIESESLSLARGVRESHPRQMPRIMYLGLS